jgi:hypothetical protein
MFNIFRIVSIILMELPKEYFKDHFRSPINSKIIQVNDLNHKLELRLNKIWHFKIDSSIKFWKEMKLEQKLNKFIWFFYCGSQ